MPPETRYAKSDGVHIAYQVVGAGPDLILVPGWISHLEMMWEEPALARYLERLTRTAQGNQAGWSQEKK